MKLQQLLSYTRKAVDDYQMIEEGDKIAIGVSGGKDSLTLLYALKGLQRFYPKHFELTAVTVNLGFEGFDLTAVKQLCEELEVPYHVIDTEIADIIFRVRKEAHPCSLCAKMRKGALNTAVKELGCNKVAYAHHRDDIIETMLLSLLFEGRFYAFSPKTFLDRMQLTVIRPMMYIPEVDVIGFRNKYQLPVAKNPCPADGATKRDYAKQLVRKLNLENPGVKDRMFHAITNGNIEGSPAERRKPMKEKAYHEKVNNRNEVHLRELCAKLPVFCKQFFIGIESTTSSRTRIAYAYDLGIFFEYLHETNPIYQKMEITHFPLQILNELKPMDIEEYLMYLKYYVKDGIEHSNDEQSLKRKLSSLKSFYNYYYRNELITQNPAAIVKMPKLHEKNIVRLDVDEVAILLDEVESGEKLTKRQQAYHEKTKVRDLAILTLMLGTGIRVSECVGLDMDDVDFKNNGIKIHRKGGKEVIVYFGEEVCEALLNYMEERENITPVEGHANALFLSMQNKRISVRSVENLVKKYSKLVTNLKNITPHKLRSTYGTNLYRETGDIYLVADVLGHKDVNTTKKHYAALEDERRRTAAKYVRLREKRED